MVDVVQEKINKNQKVDFMAPIDKSAAFYRFLYNPFLAQLTNNMTVTNQINISGEGIRSIRIPLHPTDELVRINDELTQLDKTYNKVMDNCNHQINVLKKRKSALIATAITGKIDLHHFVSKQGQPRGVQG